MSTSAVYTLLSMKDWDDSLSSNEEPTEGVFQVGGRSSWTLELTIAQVKNSGSATVKVESSPDAAEDEGWEEVTNFSGSKSSEGVTTEKGVTVGEGEEYLRARPDSISGTVWLEVTASSPFLNPGSGLQDWVSQKVREYQDGKTRLIERAEQDVVHRAVGTTPLGKLEADLTRPDALNRMKRAVASQAEHLLQRELLRRSEDQSALQQLEQLGPLANDLDDILAPILHGHGLQVWRGW